MGLPETIRVKLSSEAAGSVSMTPVVVREMATRELIELMLGLTGKDPDRIRDLLQRGTLVSGASRFRWAGWDADRASVEAALSTFPDPEPARPFAPGVCVRVVLRGAGVRIEIPREVGARPRLLRRRSFWNALMDIAAGVAPDYHDYSYREQADVYRLRVTPALAAQLRESAAMVRYSTLEQQIRAAAVEFIELYVARA